MICSAWHHAEDNTDMATADELSGAHACIQEISGLTGFAIMIAETTTLHRMNVLALCMG